jgi:hypothetical protein
MNTIQQTILIAASAGALVVLAGTGASDASTSAPLSAAPTGAGSAAAAGSNALRAAATRRLPNQLLERAPAAPVTVSAVASNGVQSVTTILPNEAPQTAIRAAPTMRATSTSSPQTANLGPCVRPGSGLVGWWQAEGNANDSAGANDGQSINYVDYNEGLVGNAFAFNGSGQSVQIPYATNLATPSFTIETWIYPTAQVYWQEFIFGQAYGRQLVVEPGDEGAWVVFYITDPDGYFLGIDSGGDIPLEQWTHLAATWDGTSLNLYTNGVLAAQSVQELSDIGDSTCPFSIGGLNDCCGADGQYFNGLIDEVSLYDRALFPGEINAIYQAGSAGKCKSPPSCVPWPASGVSWWAAEGDASDAFRINGGTLQNGAGFTNGMVGQSFVFDGTSQAVEIPHASSLVNTAFTFEAWVNPTGQVSQAFVFGQSYGRQLIVRGGNRGLTAAFVISTDRWHFREVDSSAEIALNQWTHLVGTWDGTSLSLYINGALDQQATPGVVAWDSGCAFHIGGIYDPAGTCAYTGQFFSGLIDEVTLYNAALTAEEVQAVYNAGGAGKWNIPGSWLEQYFGSNYRTDPAAALSADPDTDGLTNLQEYLQGRNPTISGTVPDSTGAVSLHVYTPSQ